MIPTDELEKPFRVNDIVRFVAGGPQMLVIDIGKHTDKAVCMWASEDGVFYGAFAQDILRLAANRPKRGVVQPINAGRQPEHLQDQSQEISR